MWRVLFTILLLKALHLKLIKNVVLKVKVFSVKIFFHGFSGFQKLKTWKFCDRLKWSKMDQKNNKKNLK